MDSSTKLLVLLGPTASSKTETSIQIAERFNCEIINADSMLVYRYMDIGTAKPDQSSRELIPHHLIDILNPDRFYSAGEFVRLAKIAIHEIQQKKRNILIAGGAGFYIEALLQGMYPSPPIDPIIRDQLVREFELKSLAVMYEKLKSLDPTTDIHPNDRYRIFRALEVLYAGSKSMTTLKEDFKAKENFLVSTLKMGLNYPKTILHERIYDRTKNMLEMGLLDEVLKLRQLGFDRNLKPLKSIGYKEAFQFIDNEIDYQMMVDCINHQTKQLAKRQQTWFKKRNNIRWFDPKAELSQLFQVIDSFLNG